MTDFFADFVPKQINGQVVVFIDEVDWMIRLPFSDEFFGTIRSCYNRRATDPIFERLTFVLLGSAAPAQLIKDPTRTPFNIGRDIELADFKPEEAKKLADQLGHDGELLLARILHWTDGHPYLTQILCANVSDTQRGGERPDELVDSVVLNTLFTEAARQEENNLKFVGDRLTQATRDRRRLLRVYRKVLRGAPVKDDPASAICTSLRLSGVIKPNSERLLCVRNRVYRRVFDEAWVRPRMPRDKAWAFAGAALLVLVAISSLWYSLLLSRYVETLETASKDSQIAYDAYDELRGPLYGLIYSGRAEELLARFFERRGDRDGALLVRARAGDGKRLTELIGNDYPRLQRTFRHNGAVTAVAFSPDGRLLVTGSEDGTARLFDLSTGREISRLVSENVIDCVAFSPLGKLVVTGTRDGTARLFDLSTLQEISRFVHQSAVQSVAFSPDGKLLATGSNTMRVFATDTDREISHSAHGGRGVAFSPDGKMVATASVDRTAEVFEAATGRVISHLEHQDRVDAVAFSPGGKLVATGSFDTTARIFEASTGREISRLTHEGRVRAVAFSPGGKLVATASEDHTARVFDVATGQEVSRLLHSQSVSAVAFSPDGKVVATASEDNTARVFEAATGREVWRFSHQSKVGAIAFSPDGKLVASGSSDGNGTRH